MSLQKDAIPCIFRNLPSYFSENSRKIKLLAKKKTEGSASLVEESAIKDLEYYTKVTKGSNLETTYKYRCILVSHPYVPVSEKKDCHIKKDILGLNANHVKRNENEKHLQEYQTGGEIECNDLLSKNLTNEYKIGRNYYFSALAGSM